MHFTQHISFLELYYPQLIFWQKISILIKFEITFHQGHSSRKWDDYLYRPSRIRYKGVYIPSHRVQILNSTHSSKFSRMLWNATTETSICPCWLVMVGPPFDRLSATLTTSQHLWTLLTLLFTVMLQEETVHEQPILSLLTSARAESVSGLLIIFSPQTFWVK